MAQRGLVALSLPFDDAACAEMFAAFEDVVLARAGLLREVAGIGPPETRPPGPG
jgi:hypothetical protein